MLAGVEGLQLFGQFLSSQELEWSIFSLQLDGRDGHLDSDRGKQLISTDMTSILSHSSSEGELNGGMSTYLVAGWGVLSVLP